MRRSKILLIVDRTRRRRNIHKTAWPQGKATKRAATRRDGGVTYVRVPNKIAKRMGKG